MYLGNILKKDFTVNNMIKTGLNGYVFDFYVDYETIDISDVINIYKYLMEKQDIKQCLDFFFIKRSCIKRFR